MHRLDLTDDRDEVLLDDLASMEMTASPSGELIAYVAAGSPQPEDEDFIVDPELHLLSPDTGEDTLVGPGLGPLWHPEGERLAYLEPTSTRACEGEVCAGSSSVIVADVDGEERRTLLKPGGWVLLGWLGDSLLAADPQEGSLIAVDEGGAERLDIQPGELWGASPDGRWLVTVEPGGLRFEPTGAGDDVHSADLEARSAGEGAWAPTSDRLALVLLAPAGQVRGSELALIEPSGRVTPVPDSDGAAGPILWAADGNGLVYARAAGARGLRLEAVFCSLDPWDCRPLLSWATGITPLALTDG